MRIFPVQTYRRLLLAIGFAAILIVGAYDLHNNRYKASVPYQALRSWIEGKKAISGDDEKYILFFMKDVAESLGGLDLVFYDIGANVGRHSLFMSKYVKEVHAFEPYPPVLEKFRTSMAVNQIKNINIHPVGLGDKNGELPFYEPPKYNLELGSFIHRPETKDKGKTMPLVIGDEWLKKKGISRVDIIKCDIEGYEKKAFLGLKDTLKRNRPIIVMELNLGLEESFQSLDDFYATFPQNYEFFCFCIENYQTGHYELCQYERFNFKKKYRRNIVVYPKEKKKYIRMEN